MTSTRDSFPARPKTTFAGAPALKSPNNVLVLFTRVNTPPALQPPTAIWHFGWFVMDVRKNLEMYRQRAEVKLLPLYTSDEGGSVFVNSDSWPGMKTKSQIAEAKAKGVQPTGGAGFAYMQGPDGAIVAQRNKPDRFNTSTCTGMNRSAPRSGTRSISTHQRIDLGRSIQRPTAKIPRSPDKTWPALEMEGMYRPFGDRAIRRRDAEFLCAARGHAACEHTGHTADHFA